MSSRNFRQMLEAKWNESKFVCVGLDPKLEKIPESFWVYQTDMSDEPERRVDVYKTMVDFNRMIIDATRDLVCAYKPNIAFYEAHGVPGLKALALTISDIRRRAPDVPIVLDGKRADIGTTNEGYVREAFTYLGADAVTVSPYLGAEALKPFLDCADKGIIVLCRTSNPGAGEFQDLDVSKQKLSEFTDGRPPKDDPDDPGWMPLYQYVAWRVANKWNKNGNCALVVGATYPEELHEVRRIVGDMPILIPGIGTQGGDLEKAVKAGKDSRGKGIIINSSSGIIGSDDPRREMQMLHNSTNQYR